MTEQAPAMSVYAGVRVLEWLCEGIAAPYATRFLADHGADVVKVEAPSGDPYRAETGFPTLNRGKRSVRSPERVDELIPKADLIVVDRPGLVLWLRERNPGAAIVTMPPWGERGPKVHDPASPNLVAAATGIFWNQQSYSEAPIELVVPLVGYAAGCLGAVAAAAGLFARARDRVAPTYEVSWVAAAAALQLGVEIQPVDEAPVERAGSAPMGSKGRVPCYRLFEAADGLWFFCACGTPRFFQRLLEVIGRADLIGDERLPAPPWGLMAPDAVAFSAPILEDAFASRPRHEWLKLLAEADIPAQPVQTRAEFAASSVARHNQLLVTVADPERGEVTMGGVPLVVEAAPGVIAGPAPRLGEHTDAALTEWGSAPPVQALPQADADEGPLHDLAVLDLSSFIAGPLVGRHLGMLGADVIKVEAPTGDPFRAFGAPFASWNQGKRSIVADLQSPEGRDTAHRLARRADVAVENFRVGVSQRLGVDAATLMALNPDLVYLSSTGYGVDPAMDGIPAFDPLLQALGGIMAAQGGMAASGDGAEPVFLTVAVHDVITPMISTFGVVAGLHHRLQTGTGQLVRTSLAQTAVAAQAAEYTSFAGSAEPTLGGWDYAGGCEPTDEPGEWRYVEGGRSVSVERFGLINSPLARDNGLATQFDHPEWGRMWTLGQVIQGAGPHPQRGPTLGEHTAEVLAELAADPGVAAPAPAPSTVL